MRTENFLSLSSRIFISTIFILSGLSKIFMWNETHQQMVDAGLPAAPVLLIAAILVELLAGVALLVGYQARNAAMLLFLYLIPTTLVFHRFWSFSSPEYQMQMAHFLKNICIMGGLLHVKLFGAGTMSIDHQRELRLRSQGINRPVEIVKRSA